MKIDLPELSYNDARETYHTIHLWTQIIGKIKLAEFPWINHSWHVTLFVTPSGLSTHHIPDRNKPFQIDLDFITHKLIITAYTGQTSQFELKDISVAGFYEKIFKALAGLEIEVTINPMPNEMEKVIPFYKDTMHATYKTEQVTALHKALLFSQNVFTRFRSGFHGKCSPVHFFWGGFDLAVSRFSGREAPRHPGGIPHMPDWVAREAYSHEVSSCGFWPGNDDVPFASYYSYIYPEPDGFKSAKVKPEEAYYHEVLREFFLPYEIVRKSENPEETLISFLETTYNAASGLAQWDRKALELKQE